MALPAPGELAAEMLRWLADAAHRRSAGERGRAWARDHYDWPQIARRWEGHYGQIVSSRPAPRAHVPSPRVGATP